MTNKLQDHLVGITADPEVSKAKIETIYQIIIDETSEARALPDWFLATCKVEPSQAAKEEELSRWRAMSAEQKKTFLRSGPPEWTAGNWFGSVARGQRDWSISSVEIRSTNSISVKLGVDGWPYSGRGPLSFLMRASGCVSVTDGKTEVW